jgi:hypothetical protein
VLTNSAKRGVVAALNVGIRWAIENKYEWVALFDQESAISEGYFDAMFVTIVSSAAPDKIGFVAPLRRIKRLLFG